MVNEIPDIIKNDAKERSYDDVLFAGTFEGISYYYYVTSKRAHYSGLPTIAKLIHNEIIFVTDLRERLRAYTYASMK